MSGGDWGGFLDLGPENPSTWPDHTPHHELQLTWPPCEEIRPQYIFLLLLHRGRNGFFFFSLVKGLVLSPETYVWSSRINLDYGGFPWQDSWGTAALPTPDWVHSPCTTGSEGGCRQPLRSACRDVLFHVFTLKTQELLFGDLFTLSLLLRSFSGTTVKPSLWGSGALTTLFSTLIH